MIGFVYLEELCRNILVKSKTIQGRFIIATKGGTEIDLDDLGKTVDEVQNTFGDGQRFPLVLMMPPFLFNAETIVSNSKYDRYKLTFFFFKNYLLQR